MKFATLALGAVACLSAVSADVFLDERFNDGEAWTKRWTPSNYRDDLGKFDLSSGKWHADEKLNAGIRTSEDYRFYALSTTFKKPFTNKGKNFVVQYSVKNEQKLDCGGGYVKLFPSGFDKESWNGESQYNIMFGPDLCGTKALIHVIFNYKGKNYDCKKKIQAPSDTTTHIFTLIVQPDQTYQVLMDGEEKAAGNFLEDWDFLPPKTIPDPDSKKPDDWVETAKIADPEDVKPAGWDEIPEFITDPDAKKPEDWDDEMDGDWEAPTINNPEFKGQWQPKMIDNPDYKGPWIQPEIPNPDYFEDDTIYSYTTEFIGLDLWQVKSGSIFDNFLVTDDIEHAEKVRKEVWDDLKDAEFKAKNDFEKAENDAAEALRKAEEEAEGEEEELELDDSELLQEEDEDENIKDEL